MSAAVAATRTLHVAAQYIQHRKDREQQQSACEDVSSAEDGAAQDGRRPMVFSNIVPASSR